MCNLDERMNPGIGPAGAGYLYRMISNRRQRLLEASLDATSVGLYLPALEIGAVVLNAQGDSGLQDATAERGTLSRE